MGPEEKREVMIDGVAIIVAKAGSNAGELNGVLGVVGTIGKEKDSGEDEGVILDVKATSFWVFKESVRVLLGYRLPLGVSMCVAGVSFCSTRFGNARCVMLIWPLSQVKSCVVSAVVMVGLRNVIVFSPKALWCRKKVESKEGKMREVIRCMFWKAMVNVAVRDGENEGGWTPLSFIIVGKNAGQV